MSKRMLVCGVIVASVAGVGGYANAGSIFIENASFEAIVLDNGTFAVGAPEGWTLTEGLFGTFNPLAISFPGVPEFSGRTVSQ